MVSNPTQAGWHQSSSGATRDGPPWMLRLTGRPIWCTAQPTRRICRESQTCTACSETPTAFNGDLSSWDVSKVTDMSDMFIFAYDFNGNLSSWDVSSVTNMNEMFAVATSFNGEPLNSWDVSKRD